MKRLAKISSLFCLLAIATVASASSGESDSFRGVDITALKARFGRALRTVEKPFYLYHWRRSPDLVESVEAQQDPQGAGLKILQNEAPLFISGLFVPNRTSSSIYGGGLYASVDPVATESYGGRYAGHFAVLSIHIPKGFRVLNLNGWWNYEPQEPTSVWGKIKSLVHSEASQIEATLKSFSCDTSKKDPDSILSSDLSPTCAELVAHILKTLKVDGFFYSYTSTSFNVCKRPDNSERRSSAMVFTSVRWLNLPGADARVYTSKTKADLEERRVIESIFAYAKTMDKVPPDPYQFDFLKLFEERNLITSQLANELRSQGRYSTDSTKCADGEGCLTKLTLSQYPYVNKPIVYGEIKLQRSDFLAFYMDRYPDRFSKQDFYKTHWTDLDGQATLADPDGWIKENLYRCGAMDSLAP